VDYKRFSDFPFQYYREIFSPGDLDEEPPVVGDVHDDLADIYGNLWHGLQALDRGDGIYAVSYWHGSYFQHWGHHASSAIYAIGDFYRKMKTGEQDAPPNSRPPSQLPMSPEVQLSDSRRTPFSGGCGWADRSDPRYTLMSIPLILLLTAMPFVIAFLIVHPRRVQMRRHARALLAQHPHAERTSVYLAFHSGWWTGKQREMDAKIAEMASAGWIFLRAGEASPLRTIRSWGGGLTLHFIRTNDH